MVARYVIVSIVSGVVFGILDGLINANPLARRLYDVYSSIARTSVNPLAGIVIDVAYGFIMAGLFLLLYPSLPGSVGVVKGISFGLLAWFFRVLMGVASTWMTFNVPASVLAYTLATGLAEMLVLGIGYGLAFAPAM
jgi:hypothetical protein